MVVLLCQSGGSSNGGCYSVNDGGESASGSGVDEAATVSGHGGGDEWQCDLLRSTVKIVYHQRVCT